MSRLTKFAAAVEQSLNDSSVKFTVGEWNDGRNDQRRRVCIYRTGGEIETASRTAATPDGTTRTEYIWTRQDSIEVLVTAEDEDTTDILFDNVITAIDRTAPNGAVTWSDFEWLHKEINQRTPLVRLRFQLALPVVEQRLPTVVIQDVLTDVQLDSLLPT